MRPRRILAAVFSATIWVGPLTGCRVGVPGVHHGAAHDAARPGPAISADASARVLDTYARRYDRAVTTGDADAWRRLATGAPAAVAEAQLRRNGGRPPRTDTFSLRNPVLYVPRISGYPRWFAAAALEHRTAGERPVFLVFTAAKAHAGWRLASRAGFRGRPPRIATDGQGYAVMVPPDATGLAMRPADLPAAEAAYLDHGDTARIVPAKFARSWRAAERRQERELRDRGVLVTAESHPSGYPVYALRTSDGGALVWYSVRRTAAYHATAAIADAVVPADVRALLGPRSGPRVVATWLWRAVAYVPVRGRPSVLIENLDLVAAQVD